MGSEGGTEVYTRSEDATFYFARSELIHPGGHLLTRSKDDCATVVFAEKIGTSVAVLEVTAANNITRLSVIPEYQQVRRLSPSPAQMMIGTSKVSGFRSGRLKRASYARIN